MLYHGPLPPESDFSQVTVFFYYPHHLSCSPQGEKRSHGIDLMEVWEKVMQMSAERVPGRRNSQCKIPELRMCLECSWRGKEAHVAKEQCARCRVEDEVGEGMRPDHVSL